MKKNALPTQKSFEKIVAWDGTKAGSTGRRLVVSGSPVFQAPGLLWSAMEKKLLKMLGFWAYFFFRQSSSNVRRNAECWKPVDKDSHFCHHIMHHRVFFKITVFSCSIRWSCKKVFSDYLKTPLYLSIYYYFLNGENFWFRCSKMAVTQFDRSRLGCSFSIFFKPLKQLMRAATTVKFVLRHCWQNFIKNERLWHKWNDALNLKENSS